MRIAIYAIARNESAHVERFLASASDADLVLVADTGSTDDTVSRLRRGGAVVHEIAINPWRFDVARNRALNLLPDDIDVCLALDLDEVVWPGWRAAVEAAWRPGVTRLRYRYVSSHGSDGAPAIEHTLAKAHARRGYRWRHAVHEDVEPIDAGAEVVADAPGLRIDHLPDPVKPRGDYLPLLELVVAEGPNNDRHAFWLGREYLFAGRWEEALAALVRYLSLPGATWEPERAAAMRYLAQATATLGREQEAECWLLRACAEAPDEREPWVDFAQSCHDSGDWAGCLAAALRALAIVERPHHYLTTDRAWGELPNDLAAICARRLGSQDVARDHVALGREQEAERWLLRACAEEPDEPETWVALAQARHDTRDWVGGLFAARRALATADAGPWRERAEDLASVCAWNIGAQDLAREHVAAALRLAPTDPRILGNARLMGVVDEPGDGITPFTGWMAAPPLRLVSTTLSGNSEEIIGDALRSVVDWVDWCLLIDTGISDDTLRIARKIAGEKLMVREFPWQDDFAAARNFALQAAHELGAAWAVTLDTDERIDAGAVDVRAALATTAADSLHVTQANGSYGKERFFRLPARGQYVGPTHEAFIRDGGSSETLEGVIFAELDKSAAQYQQKAERDIAILSRHTEEHPNDPRWFYYLGDSYAGLERHEEAIAAFRACANLNGWDEESAWAMYRAAECLLKLGRPVEAIEACALGMARHAGLAELPWLAAYAAWQAGRSAQAVYWARQSIAMGHFAGAGERVPRIGFRHPPALWEGPYDVLRFALRQLGDDAGADEAEELFAQALADREDA